MIIILEGLEPVIESGIHRISVAPRPSCNADTVFCSQYDLGISDKQGIVSAMSPFHDMT